MSLKTPCQRSHEAAQSALTHPTPGRGNLGVSWFHTSFNGATVNILRAKYLHKFFIMCLRQTLQMELPSQRKCTL